MIITNVLAVRSMKIYKKLKITRNDREYEIGLETTCNHLYTTTTLIFNTGIDPKNGKYKHPWNNYRYNIAGTRLSKVEH